MEPIGRAKWDEVGEIWKDSMAEQMPVFGKGFKVDNPITGNEVKLIDYVGASYNEQIFNSMGPLKNLNVDITHVNCENFLV